MLIKKSLLILSLSLPLFVSASEDKNQIWLNDLNCSDYTDSQSCEKLWKNLTKIEFSDYEKLTFDNQLKKITFLINKEKEKVARQRYERLFSIFKKKLEKKDEMNLALKDKINNLNTSDLNSNKEIIWDILLNYAKSPEYTPNPKYKL